MAYHHQINFRILNQSDVLEYRQLKLLALEESPYAFSESYEDEINRDIEFFRQHLDSNVNNEESFVFGAFDFQNNLIAMLKFQRDQRSKARHKSTIHTMYVKPEYRVKNIGKRLLKNLFKIISKDKTLEQIHLWVLLSKEYDATDFYNSCGFEPQGSIIKDDLKIEGQYIDARYMVKYLIK